MTCYDIVVDFEWMVDLFIDLYNLRMTCYIIVDDSKWEIDLFDNLYHQNDLLWDCRWF